MTQHLVYRPDIDGLRAIAVLSVVLYRAFPTALPGGFAGVDVFFVISGYLISLIVLKGLSHGDFSLREFYARRIRRIFPALLAVIAVCLFAGWHSLFPLEYKQLAKSSLTGLTFVANIGFWTETGYFGGDAELKPLLHLWSLGVEEQFYLAWPLVLMAAWRMGMRRITQLCVGLGLASLIASVALTPHYPEASYFLPFTRAWELLAGSLLALSTYHQQLNWRSTHIRDGIGLLGFIALFGGFFVIDSSRPFPGGWALLPVLGASLLIASGPPSIINRFVLSSKPLVWIGLISFPLYLWHWPLLAWVRILQEGVPTATQVWSAVALAFIASVFTYHVIEKPLRHQRKPWVIPSLLAMCFVLIAGSANVYRRDGLSFRLKDAQARETAKSLEWGTEMRYSDQCAPYLPAGLNGECLIADPSRPPDALIIGDSHANHYYWVLKKTLLDRGINLMQIAGGGCPVVEGFEAIKDGVLISEHCLKITEPSLEFAGQSESIQTIFVSSRWPSYITGRELKTPLGKQSREVVKFSGKEVKSLEQRSAVFSGSLSAALHRLTSTGKQVIFMHTVPEMAFHPRECISWSPNSWVNRTPRPECVTRREMVKQRRNEFQPTITAALAGFPSIKQIDPAEYLCNSSECRALQEGILLYRDDDHLSHKGAEWLGSRLRADILTALTEPKK